MGRGGEGEGRRDEGDGERRKTIGGTVGGYRGTPGTWRALRGEGRTKMFARRAPVSSAWHTRRQRYGGVGGRRRDGTDTGERPGGYEPKGQRPSMKESS